MPSVESSRSSSGSQKSSLSAAQDHVDRVQPAQRLQEDAAVAHGQVGAVDQHVAQVLRQERLLEVGRVVRPRAEQHDARVVVAGRRQRRQRLAHRAEERRQARDVAVAKDVGQHARHHDAVLERVAGAGGRLRAIGRAPGRSPDGRAHQIRGVEMQEAPVRRRQPVTGAQEARMRQHQLGRQPAFGQRALRPVEVGQQPIEQARALGQPRRRCSRTRRARSAPGSATAARAAPCRADRRTR